MNGNDAYQWLKTGNEFYAAMLAAINSAKETVRLETYIYTTDKPGNDICYALITAARRGVRVRVLIDAFGSISLPSDYWANLVASGGEYKVFNPLRLNRISFRDHRKMLVCDSNRALIGGFNISGEEAGDGVTRGWCDLGLSVTGKLVIELAASFDEMFKLADFKIRRLPRLRLPGLPGRKRQTWSQATLLTSQPGSTLSSIKSVLLNDLKTAGNIRIIAGYFLPTWALRNVLRKKARRGNDVRIITAGKSDVPLARYAGRSLYQRFLRAGVHIFEYDAQILHTKLIIADNIVYIGSANLDVRSLNINYELLARIENADLSDEARRIFDSYLPHCSAIERHTWKKARGLWEKILEQITHFILARIDTYFAGRQLHKLR